MLGANLGLFLYGEVSVMIFKPLFLSNAKPIEAKFHTALYWDGGMEVTSIDLGHMIKVAAMPIYGKNT